MSLPNSLKSNLWRLTPASMAHTLSGGEFKRYGYIDYVSTRIAMAVAKGNGRIIVSLPPRHGKSFLISKWTPVWFLARNPVGRVVLASYESSFAATWGRLARNLIEEHSEMLNIEVSSDSHSADRWDLVSGGGMFTTGIGGPITGKGGDLLLVDDPIKNIEEAMSDTVRRNQIEWFNSTFYTRCEPGATIVVLMTRWHEGDLAGYLSELHSDQWTNIRIPAIAEEKDVLKRPIGKCLNPSRYDEASLASIHKAIGTRHWNGLYQQRPSSQEGNIIKREWWRFYQGHELPVLDEMILSWDMTFKDGKKNDYVVGQCWGRVGAQFYLIDQIRKQMSFTQSLQSIRDFFGQYNGVNGVYIEDKANGPAIIDVLSDEIPGIVAVEPDGSKEARAQSVSPMIEAGQVHLPDPEQNPWVRDFIEEHANFPNAVHDDQVDAMSQALRVMRQNCIDWDFESSNVPSPFGI